MARIVAQQPVEKKRILIADAFPMLRHGLVTFLNAQPDLIVCGEADSIPSALIKIAECKPHLLVIGLRLGAGDCVEFVKALKVQTPGLLILVYSGFEESIFAMRALRAGANGYLMKRAPRDEMLAAISDILDGEIYVSRELAMSVFKEALETQPQFRLPGRPRDARLPPARLGAWHEKDRALIEPERENDRDPPRTHQTQAWFRFRPGSG